jgi:hypothetical protein
LAAVTVSARRRGLPQHRGQTPEPAKRRERWPSRPGFRARTELRAQPDQAWLRDEQVPAVMEPRLSTQPLPAGRQRSGPPTARSLPMPDVLPGDQFVLGCRPFYRCGRWADAEAGA